MWEFQRVSGFYGDVRGVEVLGYQGCDGPGSLGVQG